MNRITCTILCVSVLLLVTACQKPQAPIERTAETVATGEIGDFDMLWNACRDTIREQNFRTNRVDPIAGVITTWPVTSQQFFEFWRKDVASPWDFAEASLHTVRRRVRVDVEKSDQEDITLAVTVTKERLSATDRQYNSSASIFRTFSSQMPSTSTGRPITPADDIWVDEGRDGAMEQWLLGKIMDRYREKQSLYAQSE